MVDSKVIENEQGSAKNGEKCACILANVGGTDENVGVRMRRDRDSHTFLSHDSERIQTNLESA